MVSVRQLKEELLRQARERTSAALMNEDAVIERYKQGYIPTQSEDASFYKASNPNLKEDYTETPEETAFLAEAIESAARLSRISDLGDIYRIGVQSDTTNQIPNHPIKADQRKALRDMALNDSRIQHKVVVDGKEHIIEDYLRGARQIDETTPAIVLQEKQRLYPEKSALIKVPQANVITDDSLISMLLADNRRDLVDPVTKQMEPVISMELERRKMSSDLKEALVKERLLTTAPLSGLTQAGITPERKERQERAGLKTRSKPQGQAIREVLIGDADRGYNPRTGAPYGSPVIEDGSIVRDQLQAGHGYDFNNYMHLADDANNLAFETGRENQGSAAEAKGYDMPMETIFTNALKEAASQGKNLGPLRQKVDALARAGILDQRRVNELINAVLMPPRN